MLDTSWMSSQYKKVKLPNQYLSKDGVVAWIAAWHLLVTFASSALESLTQYLMFSNIIIW